MRQSIQSIAASENKSLNESALAGALAEYLLTGSAGKNGMPTGGLDKSLDSQKFRAIGEELIIEKLNKIFDEVKADNKEFEESYQSLKKSPERPAKKVTIVEDA